MVTERQQGNSVNILDVPSFCDLLSSEETERSLDYLKAEERLKREPYLRGLRKCRDLGDGRVIMATLDQMRVAELEGCKSLARECFPDRAEEFLRARASYRGTKTNSNYELGSW